MYSGIVLKTSKPFESEHHFDEMTSSESVEIKHAFLSDETAPSPSPLEAPATTPKAAREALNRVFAREGCLKQLPGRVYIVFLLESGA